MKKTYLLIEDDLDDQEFFISTLKELFPDTKCAVAQDASGALRFLQTTKPDSIFLDLNLPGMSGFEFLERLKSDETLKDIPVIVCSSTREYGHKVKSLGAEGFYTKPFEQQTYNAILRTFIS